MKTVVFALFFAVLNKLTTALVKKNVYINDPMTWDDAQKYCRTNYIDLSTINSEVEYKIFQIDIDIGSKEGWIGLRNNGTGWHWSDSSMGEYQMWPKDQEPADDTKNCAVITLKQGEWHTHSCDDSKEFYCYEWISGVTLIGIKMSWENALIFCSTYDSNLASLNTTRRLFDAKNITNDIVWTGLRFLAGSWFWVTGDPLELQDPLPSCPVDPYRCGARNPGADRWENRDCEEKHIFLCDGNIEQSGSFPDELEVEQISSSVPIKMT